MKTILDGIKYSDVDLDRQTVSHHINYLIYHDGEIYVEALIHLNSNDGLVEVRNKMNINGFKEKAVWNEEQKTQESIFEAEIEDIWKAIMSDDFSQIVPPHFTPSMNDLFDGELSGLLGDSFEQFKF